MLAGIAVGGAQALAAAIFYAMHSMVVMAALYFMAGLMARRAGSFDLGMAGGLWSSAPLLSALALALFFSISGLPPFSGFWPKAMMVAAAIEAGRGWLAAGMSGITGESPAGPLAASS